MSSSGTSAADTDSSIVSRPEKRQLSPPTSPESKKIRLDQGNWNLDQSSADLEKLGSDNSKVSLPSIFTTFEDPFRHELRRSSAPSLFSETNRARPSPYPPTNTRRSHLTNTQSSLSSYQFPPPSDPSEDKSSGRPKLSTDTQFGLGNSYGDQSPYPNTALSSGTTPTLSAISSSAFTSPMSPEYLHRSHGVSPQTYNDNDNWNTSPSGIIRPNSTPGQLSSPNVKYEEGIRHSSFSAPLPQHQMFGGAARISGQHDRRSMSTVKSEEWTFPQQDFVLPSSNGSYSNGGSMSAAPPFISTGAQRSPPTPATSSLVERPPRKRGKLPKETTDYLKAWLHRHSDHPYPSEEEKKQLCHATGLSMSQVSNWMINVSDRLSMTRAIWVLMFCNPGSTENSCSSTQGCIGPNDDNSLPAIGSQHVVRKHGRPHEPSLFDADRKSATLPSFIIAISPSRSSQQCIARICWVHTPYVGTSSCPKGFI